MNILKTSNLIEFQKSNNLKLDIDKIQSDWVLITKTKIKHIGNIDDSILNSSDVIYFSACDSIRNPIMLDAKTSIVILAEDEKTNKLKSRTLNKNFAESREWTYRDVANISNNFHSFDVIAIKKSSLKKINGLDKNIFDLDYFVELNPDLVIKTSLNNLTESRLQDNDLKLENLISKAFYESEKHKMSQKCAIVTASDSVMFRGLQLLSSSIKLSHDIRFIVYDIGLKKEEVKWLKSHDIEVKNLKYGIFDKNTHNWQTLNKPFYILDADEDVVLWIDADAIVLRNLQKAFDSIEENGFLMVRDNVVTYYKGPGYEYESLANKESLYEKFPVPKSQRIRDRLPNAGVFGIDKSQEIGKSIMDSWLFMIEQIKNNPKMIDADITWHDQGALCWALEKNNVGHLIEKDIYWNDCTSWHYKGQDFELNTESLLKKIPLIKSGIIHFAGHNKPWNHDV